MIFVICIILLLFIYVFENENKMLFEYHMALKTEYKKRMEQSRGQINKEKEHIQKVLSNISHDLKTPLHAFNAGLFALQNVYKNKLEVEKTEPNDVSSILHDIESNVAFMNVHINRALDISRADFGESLTPKMEHFVLREAVEWAIGITASLQSQVTIELKSAFADVMDTIVVTDKSWLEENLLCLLSNAVKYTLYIDVQLLLAVT